MTVISLHTISLSVAVGRLLAKRSSSEIHILKIMFLKGPRCTLSSNYRLHAIIYVVHLAAKHYSAKIATRQLGCMLLSASFVTAKPSIPPPFFFFKGKWISKYSRVCLYEGSVLWLIRGSPLTLIHPVQSDYSGCGEGMLMFANSTFKTKHLVLDNCPSTVVLCRCRYIKVNIWNLFDAISSGWKDQLKHSSLFKAQDTFTQCPH